MVNGPNQFKGKGRGKGEGRKERGREGGRGGEKATHKREEICAFPPLLSSPQCPVEGVRGRGGSREQNRWLLY